MTQIWGTFFGASSNPPNPCSSSNPKRTKKVKSIDKTHATRDTLRGNRLVGAQMTWSAKNVHLSPGKSWLIIQSTRRIMGKSDKWIHSYWVVDTNFTLWVVVDKPPRGRPVLQSVGHIEDLMCNAKYDVHRSIDGKQATVQAECYRFVVAQQDDKEYVVQRAHGMVFEKLMVELAMNEYLDYAGPHRSVMRYVAQSVTIAVSKSKRLKLKHLSVMCCSRLYFMFLSRI